MSSAAAASGAKLRSCVTCRQRKVRCDKLSPCSNCRRADIPCVLPSAERSPRWARRLKQQQRQQQQQQEQQGPTPAQSGLAGPARLPASSSSPSALPANDAAPSAAIDPAAVAGTTDVVAVLARLKHLEALVRDLGSAAGASPQPGASMATAYTTTPAPPLQPAAATGPIHQRFGRLILDDDATGRSRYVGSGFWSQINDELDVLRSETGHLAEGDGGAYHSTDDDWDSDLDDGEDEGGGNPCASEHTRGNARNPQRTAAERSAFLFGHNMQAPLGDAADYRPLPSQIPFLFQVFVVNVNVLGQVVHVPTMNKVIAGFLGGTTLQVDADSALGGPQELTPATEALLFAIYYAAVVSMEDEDVCLSTAWDHLCSCSV